VPNGTPDFEGFPAPKKAIIAIRNYFYRNSPYNSPYFFATIHTQGQSARNFPQTIFPFFHFGNFLIPILILAKKVLSG
jgi:hypothetical protein